MPAELAIGPTIVILPSGATSRSTGATSKDPTGDLRRAKHSRNVLSLDGSDAGLDSTWLTSTVSRERIVTSPGIEPGANGEPATRAGGPYRSTPGQLSPWAYAREA